MLTSRVLSLDAEEEQAPLTRREEAHGGLRNSSACGDGSGQNLERVKVEMFLGGEEGCGLSSGRGCAQVVVKRGSMRISDCDDLFLISHQRRTSDASRRQPKQKDARLTAWFQEAHDETNNEVGRVRRIRGTCLPINNVLMVGRCSNKVKRYTL
jgi:hypothetical protein